MAGRYNPREKRRSASAQDGAGLCTTPLPQSPHATIACATDKSSCHTQLTGCGEGSMTREGSTWRGDITQERKEGQQVHKMGQVCAPHPCHNPSRKQRMRHRQNLLHNRPHMLRRRNHNTGGKYVAGTHNPREKRKSAGAQDGAGMCTTPMPQPLTQPSHALPTKPIAQPYLLAAMKEARHRREACCGRHNPREKGRLEMEQGGIPMHHAYAIRPSPNPRMHCRKTPFAQPNSLAVTKETKHGRETRSGEIQPKREKKVSKCTRWGRSVHHTHATTPHATHACIANKTYCTTVLTCCDEGNKTREGNTWRGDMNQERKEGQQLHKMGHVCAPQPMPQPLTQPTHAPPKKSLAQSYSLAARKEARHGRVERSGNT